MRPHEGSTIVNWEFNKGKINIWNILSEFEAALAVTLKDYTSNMV